MKVHRSEAGKVCIELDNQREIDALWVLAGHVNGGIATLRNVFSCPADERQGLYELLLPYVTPVFIEEVEAGLINVPRETTELLHHHQQNVSGSIRFEPMPNKVSDPRPLTALSSVKPLTEESS